MADVLEVLQASEAQEGDALDMALSMALSWSGMDRVTALSAADGGTGGAVGAVGAVGAPASALSAA
ncbi:hypothetical protein ACHFCA_24795 [Delftia tsuruhatensis]